MLTKRTIEDYVSNELEDKTFDELLEEYDLSPGEVFWLLFTQGQIDEVILTARFDDYS